MLYLLAMFISCLKLLLIASESSFFIFQFDASNLLTHLNILRALLFPWQLVRQHACGLISYFDISYAFFCANIHILLATWIVLLFAFAPYNPGQPSPWNYFYH